MKQRYVLTTQMFIYADDDKKAKSLAKYIVDRQKMKYDNQCSATELVSVPFGRIGSSDNLIDGDVI